MAALLAVLAAMVLASCSHSSKAATTTSVATTSVMNAAPSSTTTRRAAPTVLEGSWTAEFTGAPSELVAGQEVMDRGIWKLTFVGDGATFTNPGHPGSPPFDVGSPFAVSGTTVTFTPVPGCPTQVKPVTPGAYTFAITGSQLVLTKVQDSCQDRASTLTAHPWTRAG